MFIRNVLLAMSCMTLAAQLEAQAQPIRYNCKYPMGPALTGYPASLPAAITMGAHCFGRSPSGTSDYFAPSEADWVAVSRQAYTLQCAGSSTGSGVTWPGSCNPLGAQSLMNARSAAVAANHHWVTYVRPNTASSVGIDMLNYMRWYQTPIVLPLHGSWLHWVALVEILTQKMPTGEEIFTNVTFRDALPFGVTDGTSEQNDGKTYGPIKTLMNARTFIGAYYQIVGFPSAPPAFIGPACDATLSCMVAPGNDPWYYRWVFLYEPPPGAAAAPPPASLASGVAAAPGILPKGAVMTADRAVRGVHESLRLADVDRDPELRRILDKDIFEKAYLVRGMFASEMPWDYYLLPVRTAEGKISAFIQLSASDGGFAAANLLRDPADIKLADEATAREAAQQVTKPGEQLGPAVLSWRPLVRGGLTDSPALPYYEFPVQDGRGRARGVIRVAQHDVSLVRRAADTSN